MRQSFLSGDWHCQIDCWQIRCYCLTFNDPRQLRQAGKPDLCPVISCHVCSLAYQESFPHACPCRRQLQSSLRNAHHGMPSWYALFNQTGGVAGFLSLSARPELGCSVAAHSSIYGSAVSLADYTVCMQGLKLKLRLRRPWHP